MIKRGLLNFSLLSILLLSSCLGTRYLKENETLLYKQKIVGNKITKSENLTPLLLQKPNRKIPIINFPTYVWLYELGLKNFDTTKVKNKRLSTIEKFDNKIKAASNDKRKGRLQNKKAKQTLRHERHLREGNFPMRWGEPVAIYDSTATIHSNERLASYLKSKGLFGGQTVWSEKRRKRRVTITHTLLEGKPHKVDSVFFEIADTAIYTIVVASTSLIKKKANYDNSLIAKERERIEGLLKDNGYYDFSRQYISFNIDTLQAKQKLNITTIIKNPAKRSRHKIFRLDSIIFNSNAKTGTGKTPREFGVYNNITYRFFENRYNKKVLDQRLFLKKGELYSRSKTFETQRQLANLDMFKFINIKYDTSGGKFIANLYTNPLNKYQMSNEVGITVIQRLPGPFYNLSIKNRNVFNGIEVLEFNGRIGLEGVPSASDVEETLTSREIGANFTLTFPQFILPFGSNFRTKLGKLNPRTQLLLGYTSINRPEYIRSNINSSLAYSWENRKRTRFSLKLIDLSVINSEIKTLSDGSASPFQTRLDELKKNGNNLFRSFEPSIVSNIGLTATFNFNKYGSFQNKASYLILGIENGGTILTLIDNGFLERQGLESYQYVRVGADYRHHRPISRSSHLAYRVNVGYALPYGQQKTLPYEKFYFIGGSNSVRAWRPRRLGPGGFNSLDTLGNYTDQFEQEGEILFEASIELRQKLIGFLSGALFVDIGNIWRIEENSIRSGGKFSPSSFYNELAIGAGSGLRFDFSFLVLRLDVGVKIYDPARPQKSRFILSKGFNDIPYNSISNDNTSVEPVILNIGIGYPF